MQFISKYSHFLFIFQLLLVFGHPHFMLMYLNPLVLLMINSRNPKEKGLTFDILSEFSEFPYTRVDMTIVLLVVEGGEESVEEEYLFVFEYYHVHQSEGLGHLFEPLVVVPLGLELTA